jgi:hypothetical protein
MHDIQKMHNQPWCGLAGYGQEYGQNDALSDTHAIFKHFSLHTTPWGIVEVFHMCAGA